MSIEINLNLYEEASKNKRMKNIIFTIMKSLQILMEDINKKRVLIYYIGKKLFEIIIIF